MNRILSAAAMLTFAGSAHAAVLNSGFESMGSGATDASDWNQLEITTGLGSVRTERGSGNQFSGDWAMEFELTGAVGDGPVAEIQQFTSAGSVSAGNSYDFSFWAKGDPTAPGAAAFYEVTWWDADGSNGGGSQGAASGLQNFGLSTTYTQISLAGLVAPVGADSIFIQIRLVTGAFDGASGTMYVDDVAFTPAPAGVALLGLGGLAAGRRRR